MSLFYPNSELTVPLSITMAATMAAQVLSSPIAAILMSLDGLGGFPGWQLLCIAEGLGTMCAGISLVVFLPHAPADVPGVSAAELSWIDAGVSRCAPYFERFRGQESEPGRR